MRIASISKSMTMFMLGKLLEQGKLELDRPISQYLSADKFPEKSFDRQKVEITLRWVEGRRINFQPFQSFQSDPNPNSSHRQLVSHLAGIRHYKYEKKDAGEFDAKEYHLNTKFDSVYESVKLFKDDDLQSRPGSSYLYSTHGFTLISAVIQSVLENDQKFETELIKLLRNELGMYSTLLDANETIVPNRAKYYTKQENKLVNVREVDNR